MILRFEQDTNLYILSTQRHEADVPRKAQFLWHGNQRCGTDSCQGCKHKAPLYTWWTNDAQRAAKVAEYASDPGLKNYLLSLKSQQDEARAASRAVDADIEIPVPEGLELYPFQISNGVTPNRRARRRKNRSEGQGSKTGRRSWKKLN